jgi:hypothetical protein
MSSTLSRIEREFVLRSLQDTEHLVTLETGTVKLRCYLLEYTGDSLTLECATGGADRLRPDTDVALQFFFRNARMRSELRVKSISGKRIVTTIPREITKDRSRLHERVKAAADWRITCLLEGERVELGFPKAETEHHGAPLELSSRFDASTVADLLKAFREKIQHQSSETRIVMFRERKPSGLEETMIARSGLMLYIPSTTEGYPELQLFPDKRILTREMIQRALDANRARHDGPFETVDELLMAKKTRGILSEVYCPIRYKEYVVGYVYLMSARGTGKVIGPQVVSFLTRFSQILAYALKQNGYFKTERVAEPFTGARLIDISASGLLCAVDQRLAKRFNLFSRIGIVLSINARDIRLEADIVREFADEKLSFFGLQFVDVKPETRETLQELIYGD